MQIDIDPIFSKELLEQNPEDVCERALCKYNHVKKCYNLIVLADEYSIFPYESKIERISNNFCAPHKNLYLFIIQYLLKAKKINLYNEWISQNDIQGGPTFFRGPHQIPTNFISSHYKYDIDKFKIACEKFNGVFIDMADAAYVFKVTPRIQVAVLYWSGDDEFLPEAKLLYDKSIIKHLSLDIVFALSVDICTRIGQ